MPERKRRQRKSRVLDAYNMKLAEEVLEAVKAEITKDEDWEDAAKVKKAYQKAYGDIVGKEVPNRRTLRMRGLNTARTTGKNHARVSGAKKPPASLYTHVAIRLTRSDGKPGKTIVVPRESLERK